MVSINSKLSTYLHAYKQWISSQPRIIAEIENTIRYLSYFTAGRYSNSSFISEFIYSLPNLFILVNDCLIYNTKYIDLKLPQYNSKIKIWLTIVEYVEALLEISIKKLWGDRGKWIIIFIIQALKAILGLILIHRNAERITHNPAIPMLNREKLNDEWQKKDVAKDGFILKRSGVVVRSVTATKSYNSRLWVPLPQKVNLIESGSHITMRSLLLAETLYITKPLIQLTTLLIKGNKHWLPWTIALIMDVISLNIITCELSDNQLTKEEYEEIHRRRINLLLYILRSPFYDKYSKRKINLLLNFICNNIPLGKLIGEPLIKYLPHWQGTYFYMWSH